jgi:hypothetical protein
MFPGTGRRYPIPVAITRSVTHFLGGWSTMVDIVELIGMLCQLRLTLSNVSA